MPQNLSFHDITKSIKERFHSIEHRRALFQEGDSLLLNAIISLRADKTPSECLEVLILNVCEIQALLPDEYRSDTIFRYKLLNSVSDVDDCRQAFHKQADTVSGVTFDLHASLSTSKQNDDES